MDWSRAKTILIISFLCLDLFLVWQVWINRSEWQIAEQNLRSASGLENELRKLEIALDAEIPVDTPEMNYLHVRYGMNLTVNEEYSPGQIIDQSEGKVISIFAEAIPLEEPEEPDKWPQGLKEKLIDYAEYRHDPYQKSDQGISFYQVYQKTPLFNAVLQLKWKDGLVMGYEQTYFEVISRGSGRKVISASTAILTMVENGIIKQGEKIESVELGYYSPTYDAEIQVLSPVWRVVHSGNIHYINGITGVIEKRPSLEK